MRDRDQCHVSFKLVPERSLYDYICLIICITRYVNISLKKDEGKTLPIADVAAEEKKLSQRGQRRKQGKTSTFVENEQLATAYYRTSERQDLPLSDGEVSPATCNRAIKSETGIVVVGL